MKDYLVIPDSDKKEIISASSAYIARERYFVKHGKQKILIVPAKLVHVKDADNKMESYLISRTD